MALVSWANDPQFGCCKPHALLTFQQNVHMLEQFLLHRRARTGRAGAFPTRAQALPFWFLVRVVHLSCMKNCVNACGVCKRALLPCRSHQLFLETGGAFLTLSQSFDRRRALVTNRPSLPSKYVVSEKLTPAIGWCAEYVHCPTTSDCKRALPRNGRKS